MARSRARSPARTGGAGYGFGRLEVPLGWGRAVSVLLVSVAAVELAALAFIVLWGPRVLRLGGVAVRLRDAEHPAGIATVAVLALLAWSRPARRTVLRLAGSVGFWVAATVAAFVLSLGPTITSAGVRVATGPYRLLYEHVPGFDGIRVPARLALEVALFVAVLAGFALARLAKEGSGDSSVVQAGKVSRRLLVAVGLLFLVEVWPPPVLINYTDPVERAVTPPSPVPHGRETPPVYAFLAGLPEDTVILEMPFGREGYELRYLFYSTLHWRRLVNGYSGGLPDHYYRLTLELGHPVRNWDRAWTALAASTARVVVVHEGAYLGDQGPRVTQWMEYHGARRLASFGADVVFALPSPDGRRTMTRLKSFAPSMGNPITVFAWYVALTVVMTWPVSGALARKLPLDLADPLLNCWILWWDLDHLTRFLSGEWNAFAGFWSANIFHPEPLAFAYSEHLFAQALQALPVYAISRNIVLSYNLLFLSTFALSGLGMFLLARELTGRPRAAFVAGLLYAFAPYRTSQFGHLQVLSSQWMPFALYALRRYFAAVVRRRESATPPASLPGAAPSTDRARTDRREAEGGGRVKPRAARREVVPLLGAALAIVLQGLSCGYFLLFFAPFLVLFVVWEVWTRRLWTNARMWGELAAAGVLAGALLLPFLLPYLALRDHGFAARPLDEVRQYSADAYSYLAGSDSLRLWRPYLSDFGTPEGVLFPGLVPVALALAGLAVAVWAAAREERPLPPTRGWRLVVAVLAGLATVAFLRLAFWELLAGPLIWRVRELLHAAGLREPRHRARGIVLPGCRRRLVNGPARDRPRAAVARRVLLLRAAAVDLAVLRAPHPHETPRPDGRHHLRLAVPLCPGVRRPPRAGAVRDAWDDVPRRPVGLEPGRARSVEALGPRGDGPGRDRLPRRGVDRAGPGESPRVAAPRHGEDGPGRARGGSRTAVRVRCPPSAFAPRTIEGLRRDKSAYAPRRTRGPARQVRLPPHPTGQGEAPSWWSCRSASCTTRRAPCTFRRSTATRSSTVTAAGSRRATCGGGRRSWTLPPGRTRHGKP